MALPVTIPNTFANATASIPLSQLDTNFTTLANAVNGISDGSETLANASVTVLTAGTVDINGGAIDGTTVGTSNAAAGSFTTLNTSGAVVFNDAGADVDFRVEGDTDANLLFVDASADAVGIGTSSPSSILHLSQTAPTISATSTNNSSGLRFNVAGTAVSTYRFQYGGNTQATIDSSGNVAIANGNLVFSTNGTGIDFSASAGGGASSSLLDDYEEGTWTPTISGTSVTYSNQVGHYVKIGTMVLVRGRLTLTGGTISATIQSLPFTSSSGIEWISMNLWHSGGITFPAGTTYISGYVNLGSTNASIEAGGSAVTSSSVTVANNANFYFAFYYSTN